MNIVQITPGAGGMYCGNCFRDNALVAALRNLGHSTTMIPLYLPMTLEGEDQSAGTPIFFGGISVYLEQKGEWFRRMPGWLHRWLAMPALLRWAAGRAAKTRACEVADLTISMLRGEEGHQARELDLLVEWLRDNGKPDIISLSNALLIGLARRLKQDLGVPVVCMLQGEDSFLDALPEPQRAAAWALIRQRAKEIDLFTAPSRYFANYMGGRLGLAPDQIQVVYNGIDADEFAPAPELPQHPTIGYFARMCPEKGLDRVVEAFLILKQRGSIPDLKLRIGGGLGPSDRAFVDRLRRRIAQAGHSLDVQFCPNLNRAGKRQFFQSLTVFSTPAVYNEAFGLYLIEALAAGVPVVQPRHAAFPELIELTGGGVLFEPHEPEALAVALEKLLLDPAEARAKGNAGARAVRDRFTVQSMAAGVLDAFNRVPNRASLQRRALPEQVDPMHPAAKPAGPLTH